MERKRHWDRYQAHPMPSDKWDLAVFLLCLAILIGLATTAGVIYFGVN